MAVTTPMDDLAQVSAQFENASAEEILKWAWETYGSGLAMATAFGAEGCVLLEMLSRVAPETYVFNLDTGYQFRETLELREQILERYGLAVDLVKPETTVPEFEQRYGGPLYGTDPDQCCKHRKVLPLRRALEGRTAWISAIRRDQTRDRSRVPIIQWDSKFKLVKISPLAQWTKNDVWTYILRNGVPYNPLHDSGYPSIGCWPCTKPVQAGDDDRAGRWSGFAKTECGLHAAG